MEDPEVNAAIETLSRSNDVQELQTALMNFSLRIDANSCSQPLREKLWKAISTNAKFWRLFFEDKDSTLPQLAVHVLSAFAGDEFLLRWPPIGEMLPKLAARIKDIPSDKLVAVESFSSDLLTVCLACVRDPRLALPIAITILHISKILPRSSFVNTPQFFQYACDTIRNIVMAEKWYRDGSVRTVFTWLVNLGLSLFVSDLSAAKFEIARLTGAVLLNAAPPASAKHRICVINSFLPEENVIPLVDGIRGVMLSRSAAVSKRHVTAIVVFNSGLQRWLCRGDGDLWLFAANSKLFQTQEELEKFVPILAVHCSTEFARIITKPEEGNKPKVEPEDDQALAASLQLMEDLLEFIVLRSDENAKEQKALSSSVLLETHRCLREAAISAILRLVGEEFEQPDNFGVYGEEGGLKMACFRWGCRFVAQDAASIEGDTLATLVRYGANGLSVVSTTTANLVPMFAAALCNILSLDSTDKEKETVRRCFFDNGVPKLSTQTETQTYRDHILYLVNNLWQRKADEVDSCEGKELLSSLKENLLKLENK